jgi:integrase
MAHVEDRWFRVVKGEDQKPVRVKTELHGKGLRYRVRYYNADGKERSKSFPDRQKKAADDYLTEVESQRLRGAFVDPAAGRLGFPRYALEWLDRQTFDEATREVTERRLRNHILPRLDYELAAIRPEHIRKMDRSMQIAGLSESYRLVAFGNVSTILNAAVDDGRITKNPCKARSAKPPKGRTARVIPWDSRTVAALRCGMPSRYRIAVDLGAGCGFRQGEALGFSDADIDAERRILRVERQIKIVRNRLVFAEPKGRKTREVPLAESVAQRLDEHLREYPPVVVTLPWDVPEGKLVSVRLILYGKTGVALDRNYFNENFWWPAAKAAGLTRERKNGMHALRHFYASTLLDAGESIKALAAYLGHSDPGFTLRTYTHLMPSSEERTRKAIDRVFGYTTSSRPDDGLDDQQASEAAA